MATTLRSAFTTTVRVVDGVHRRTTNVRTTSQPTGTAGLAQANVHVIAVSDLTDRGTTGARNTANFAAWQQQLSPVGFPSLERRLSARTAAHDGTATGTHFDATNRGSQRNILQRQAVADDRSGIGAVFKSIARFDAGGSDDVSLLTVGILEQRNPSRTVGVVLNRIDHADHAVLDATEVDHAVHLLVATTAVTRCDLALVVTTAGLSLRTQQGTLGLVALRQILEVADRRVASTGAGRFVDSDAHGSSF